MRSSMKAILIAVSLPACTGLGAAGAKRGCVLHYAFERLSADSKQVKDLSGKGNHGQLMNNVQVCPGVNGNGLYFDGKGEKGSYIRVPSSATIRDFPAISMELWIAPGDPRKHRCGLISASNNPDPEEQKKCPVRFEIKQWSFQIFFHTEDGRKNYLSAGTRYDMDVLTFPKPTWHHIVATYHSKDIFLYVDGREVARRTIQKELPIASITEALIIGKMGKTPGLGGLSHPYVGRMDEVRIYDRVLSPEEVLSHHAMQKGFRPAAEKTKAVAWTIDGKPYVGFNYMSNRAWKGCYVRAERPYVNVEFSNTGEIWVIGWSGRRKSRVDCARLPGQGGREDFYKHLAAILKLTPPGKEKSLELTGTTHHGAKIRQRVLITPDAEFKYWYEITIPTKNSGINAMIPKGAALGWTEAGTFAGYEGDKLVKGRFIDLTRRVCFEDTVETYSRNGVRGVYRFPPGIVWQVDGKPRFREFSKGPSLFHGKIRRKLLDTTVEYPEKVVLEYSFQACDDSLRPALDMDKAREITPETVIDFSKIQKMSAKKPAIEAEGRDLPVFGIDEKVTLAVRMPPKCLSELKGSRYVITITDAYSGKKIVEIEDCVPKEWWSWVGDISFVAPKPGVYVVRTVFRDKDGEVVLHALESEVAVAGPIEQPEIKEGEELKLRLVDACDLTTKEPGHEFYSFSGKSQVVSADGVKYRRTLSMKEMRMAYETGNRDWIGCRLDMRDPKKDHVVEIIYANLDDTINTVNVLEPLGADGEDAKTAVGRVGTGIITGGVFPFDGKLKSFKTVYIPTGKSKWCAVVCKSQIENPIGVARINLYEVPGALPRLEKMGNGRLISVNTEGGSVGIGSFGYNELSGEHAYPWTRKLRREKFYTEYYRAIANLIRVLRFRGENCYNFGAYRYDWAEFPSRYVRYKLDRDLDFAALMAKMFEYNDLKIIMNVMNSGNINLMRLVRYSTYDMTNGAPISRQVSRDGKIQNGYWFWTLPNPFNPRVQDVYRRLAEELGDRYGGYKSFAGISWLYGALGLGAPSLYQHAGFGVTEEAFKSRFDSLFFDYTYDDLTMQQFGKYAGIKLPGKVGDPDRFKERYEWIMANAKEKWIDFRCWAIAEMHKGFKEAFCRKAPGRKYFVFDYGYADVMGTCEAPLKLTELARLCCAEPKYYKGVPGLVYCPYVPTMDGSQQRKNAHGYLSKEWVIPNIARFAKDEEFYSACDSDSDTGRYLHRQFLETPTINYLDETRPWLLTSSRNFGKTKICNNNYPQPAGRNWFADFTQMLAYATPSFISYMWCDAQFPLGHYEQMQKFTRAYRRLPLGEYETVKRKGGVFVRKTDEAFYIVETKGNAAECVLAPDLLEPGAYRDAVSGERLTKNSEGKHEISMEPYGFRVFLKK